jgi:hypothetical protein
MTEEQIKQNAEKYADVFGRHMVDYYGVKDAFIEGAHSRDEEIKELKEEIESLQEQYNTCFDGFTKRGTKMGELMKENVKLRNPWISVEDRLPMENPNNKGYSVEVIGLFSDDCICKCDCSIEEGIWFIGIITSDPPTHWMPIPQLKGE